MKKAILTSLIILCLSSALFLKGHKISVKASPDVIYVPTDHPTIQEAINTANEGDTVFVYKGTYRENIVINKTVSLIGEDMNLTVIDGNAIDNVIYINVSSVVIHGFTIRNSYPTKSGIHIERAININISQNLIKDTGNGINLIYSSNNLIANNIIALNYYNGLYLLYSGNNVISNNNISLNKLGILFQYSTNNIVLGNTMLDNFDWGLYIDNSSNNTIYRNNFDNYLGNNAKILQGGLINAWDYGGEGNYWSDYIGQDLNKNGIGNTPHILDANNQDNFPLMGIFHDFNVLYAEETHSVTIISNSTISGFEFRISQQTGKGIMSFDAKGWDGTVGFCRVRIPTRLMEYPYIALVDSEEVVPTELGFSNGTYVYLYFTYPHNRTITIISSETLRLYYELLNSYLELQKAFNELNETYYSLLANFTTLQSDLHALNKTYYELLNNYNILLSNYSQLQKDFEELNLSFQELSSLNRTYYSLLNGYNSLLDNYTNLQRSFDELNSSYQEHLQKYSEQTQNTKSLTYMFMATTAIFIIAVIYLSKRAYANTTAKAKVIE